MAIIDYLSFTVKSEVFFDDYKNGLCVPCDFKMWHPDLSLDYDEFCYYFVQSFLVDCSVFGFDFHLLKSGNGIFGYSNSLIITDDVGVHLGVVGFGGNAGTMYISFSGKGCRYLNFEQFDDFKVCSVYRYLQLCDAKITRVDLAIDFMDGEYTVDFAYDAYVAGKFGFSGRTQPKGRFIDDLGSGDGRTLYVGSVKNGKMCRCYEKGKQLGDKESEWVRFEVQFGCRDRVIPLDILIRTDEYFVGSYPVFSDVVLDVVPDCITVSKKSVSISYSRLTNYCRVSYGKLIDFMSSEMCLCCDDIVSILFREGVPKRISADLGSSVLL